MQAGKGGFMVLPCPYSQGSLQEENGKGLTVPLNIVRAAPLALFASAYLFGFGLATA